MLVTVGGTTDECAWSTAQSAAKSIQLADIATGRQTIQQYCSLKTSQIAELNNTDREQIYRPAFKVF